MTPGSLIGYFLSNETVLIVVLFWLFCAATAALLASTRRRNSFKWFAWGLLLGPLAFILVVLPSPAHKDDHDEKRA